MLPVQVPMLPVRVVTATAPQYAMRSETFPRAAYATTIAVEIITHA